MPQNRLAISVEDVQQYKNFVLDQLRTQTETKDDALPIDKDQLSPFLEMLAKKVHPLALGNVHRVHLQIKQLAQNLLKLHSIEGRDLDKIILSLTTRFYSHLHMINRHEAREILGEQQVEFAKQELSNALDDLLRTYENDFALRKPFFLAAHFAINPAEEDRFIAGAIESKSWSYLYETRVKLSQQSQLPPNVQVQLPPGQPMPLIPGLPKQYNWELTSQHWMHNTEPKGVTIR